MKKTLFVLFFATFIAINQSSASALSVNDGLLGLKKNKLLEITVLGQAEPPKPSVLAVQPPQPVVYIVQPGDTLEKIAKENNTNVDRLFDKNTDISNPDTIAINQRVIIPQADEVLTKREYIRPSLPVALTQPRGVVAGNSYTWGNCTWYVKNMRPDIPNNLGNADTWYYRAAAQGFAVGNSPRVGAVAAARGYMHVALVIAVDGNRVRVSEMNYAGFNVISERWSDNSEWHYIY